MARFSPIMNEVRAFADRGGPVLGICNGFQILLEAGLLPGAMLRNNGLKYRCEHVHVRVEQTDTPFTSAASAGQVLRIPIGHGEGNYLRAAGHAAKLEANRQVIFRYTDPQGRVDDAANPNGSVNAIAGICNEQRNVVGMMPHPGARVRAAARRRGRLRDLRIGAALGREPSLAVGVRPRCATARRTTTKTLDDERQRTSRRRRRT